MKKPRRTRPKGRGPEPARDRHRWWLIVVAAVVIITYGVMMTGIAHVAPDNRARGLEFPVTEYPLDWGQSSSDKGLNGYMYSIAVGLPVADGGPNSDGTQVVSCNVRVLNFTGLELAIPADAFLMWEKVEDGPLHPIEDAYVAHVSPGEATFVLRFLRTNATEAACVTYEDSIVSSNPERSDSWYLSHYLQWGP